MSGFIKFYDEASLPLRIVLAVVAIPSFLYRLFKFIIAKGQGTPNLIYLICNVIPFIGTVIWVIDIVFCALKRPLPLCFADWTKQPAKETTEGAVEVEATEPKEEPKPEEEKPAE
ncbi:MAG: hypothetical protein K6E59_02385 [Bacilli bacterium]|nr:hypothetical protein [Bacilli bacterium]